MAFSGIDDGLSVIELDPISGSTSYSYKQLVDDKSVLLTSAPAMVIAPNGNLIIRYGVDGQSQKNVAFVTTSTDGINFSTAQKTTGLAPTQSAMVVFKGALYVLDGQDNQYGGVFESTLDNNGFIVPNTTHQISGWFTSAGISAVVFNNSIVAATQQDDSTHYFNIFSSADGSTWSGKAYPNKENFTPKLALFNSGISAVTIANDSSYSLWTDYASY